MAGGNVKSVMSLDLFAKPDPPYLSCFQCQRDIDLQTLFLRDGICADCEYPPIDNSPD